MADERESSEGHEFIYCGPINRGNRTQSQTPLTPEAARTVALKAWCKGGRLRPTEHFRHRSIERKFTIIEVEFVVRNGRPTDRPEFCERFNTYKYRFEAIVDGLPLRVAFALDATQDYDATPLVILITAVWKTKSGLRAR